MYLKTVGGDEKKASLVLAKKFGTPKAKGELGIIVSKLSDVVSAGIPADEIVATAEQVFGILGIRAIPPASNVYYELRP